MADTIIKTTTLGMISMEITLNGEAPKIPGSEIHDLIKILRETADALDVTFRQLHKGQLVMGMSSGVH